jgi:hypothetical protein
LRSTEKKKIKIVCLSYSLPHSFSLPFPSFPVPLPPFGLIGEARAYRRSKGNRREGKEGRAAISLASQPARPKGAGATHPPKGKGAVFQRPARKLSFPLLGLLFPCPALASQPKGFLAVEIAALPSFPFPLLGAGGNEGKGSFSKASKSGLRSKEKKKVGKPTLKMLV